MANPPITVGLFTNVPAPGSPIRSDWPQQAANLISTSLDQGTNQGPYVGAWPPGSGSPPPFRLVARSGHSTVTTSAYGDAIVNFQTAFPNGVISVQVTPVNQGVWWWPIVNNTFLTGFQFFATSVNGYPYATTHPPSQPNVWTMGNGTVTVDYIAIGV